MIVFAKIVLVTEIQERSVLIVGLPRLIILWVAVRREKIPTLDAFA